MSRNASEYIPHLFEQLLKFTGKEKELTGKLKSEHIESEEIRKNFSSNIIIDRNLIAPLATGGVVIDMKCNDTHSLVLIGSRVGLSDLNGLSSSDNFSYNETFNPALFLILTKDFKPYIKVGSIYQTEKKNDIENFLDIIDEEYRGHSIEDISKYYEPIYIVDIKPNSVLKDQDFISLIISLSIEIPSLLHCKNKEFLEAVRKISDIENKYTEEKYIIDAEMLYQSLTSFYSRHAFLDIYRCLEKLFYFPETYRLHQELKKKNFSFIIELHDLKNICEESISWKRIEKESITKLFELVFCQNIDIFDRIYSESSEKIFGRLSDEPYEKSDDEDEVLKSKKIKAKFIAEKIYMYRNSLVHHEDKEFRNNVQELSEDDWQTLANGIAIFLLEFKNIFTPFFKNTNQN